MGEVTKIAWTHHTFNPWRGCTKVSAGCANCYAETLSKRNPAVLGEWGPEGKRAFASHGYWHQPFAWDRAAAAAGERRRVFCASLADVFEDRPELVDPRARLFDVIGATPNLDWLLLTKRPQNIIRLWPDGYRLKNAWLGVSVEDQKTADERIPLLLDTPAALHFVSAEPLLGHVDTRRWLGGSLAPTLPAAVIAERWGKVGLGWVIVGGESGPKARPCNVAWIRRVVEQCRETKTACFTKQLGDRAMCREDSIEGRRAGDHPEREWPIGTLFGTAPGHMGTEWQGRHAQGKACYEEGRCVGRPEPLSRACSDPAEWPEDLRVREFPEVTHA